MALRKRDKKGYPQFVGRIIEWRNSGWENGKIQYVRVAGFDYDIGVTFVNVNDKTDNFTCLNGPLSPVRKKERCVSIPQYEKEFEYALTVLRTNSIYDVDEKNKLTGSRQLGFGMAGCAFGV